MVDKKNKKLVVQSDLMEQVWYQIDRYLQKKWPDIFLDDGMKEFKKGIEDKYNEVMHSKNLINARYLEWEKSQERKIIDLERRLNDKFHHIQSQINAMDINLSDKKWWQFWKPVVVINKTKEQEDED